MKEGMNEWRRTKLSFSCFFFFTLLKVSGTYRIDLAMEQQRHMLSVILLNFPASVCGICSYTLLYVQAVILNLPHPYYKK